MFRTTFGLALFCSVAIPFAIGWQRGEDAQGTIPKNGVAVLAPTEGNQVVGTLTLTSEDGYVQIRGEVCNLTPGEHGFHIHEYGDLRDGKGESAGSHYNPTHASHGGPGDRTRHAGDLGNILANDDGVAKVNVLARDLKLHHILGRSIVVHAKGDDLKSQPAGDSGDRLAVGVIGVAKPNGK